MKKGKAERRMISIRPELMEKAKLISGNMGSRGIQIALEAFEESKIYISQKVDKLFYVDFHGQIGKTFKQNSFADLKTANEYVRFIMENYNGRKKVAVYYE